MTIIFSLINGGTLGDVINELNDSTVRIGIHVIDFDGGGSESFITPEPTTIMLLGFAAAGVLARRPRLA